jgi:hypothetical protein
LIDFKLLLNVLKDIMEDLESLDKAAWTKEMLHIFCDICIKAIDTGMILLVSIKRGGNFL